MFSLISTLFFAQLLELASAIAPLLSCEQLRTGLFRSAAYACDSDRLTAHELTADPVCTVITVVVVGNTGAVAT